MCYTFVPRRIILTQATGTTLLASLVLTPVVFFKSHFWRTYSSQGQTEQTERFSARAAQHLLLDKMSFRHKNTAFWSAVGEWSPITWELQRASYSSGKTIGVCLTIAPTPSFLSSLNLTCTAPFNSRKRLSLRFIKLGQSAEVVLAER